MKNLSPVFIVLTALNIMFVLVSDVTAGKLISIMGFTVSITVLYFPFTLILSDITTEVYGFQKAKFVLNITLVCSIIAGLIYQLTIFMPAAVIFDHNDSYKEVFSTVPRILIGGWAAIYTGEMVNNYIMSRMKRMMGSQYFALRAIVSTIAGQTTNTTVFYLIGLYGVLPNSVLIEAILAASIFKIVIETCMVPMTSMICRKIQSLELEDQERIKRFGFRNPQLQD